MYHYLVSFLYFEGMILSPSRLLLLRVMLYVGSKDRTRAGYISLLSDRLLSLSALISGGTSRSTAVLVPASCDYCCCKKIFKIFCFLKLRRLLAVRMCCFSRGLNFFRCDTIFSNVTDIEQFYRPAGAFDFLLL